jgi:hypothetical protein
MLRLLLFLALLLPVSAQETMIREVFDPGTDTHVEVLALFSRPSPSGYFPVRVKIANNLKDERPIRLDFEGASYDYNSNLKSGSSFDFSADAGKTVTRDILVPISPSAASGQASVTVTLSGSLGTGANTISSNFDASRPAVLLSEALFTPNASALDAEVNSTSSSGYRSGSNEFAGKFDPKQLPDDWLAFSGYDSVMMTDSDWSNVPPGGRNAILSWLRLGGQLVIYSSTATSAAALGLPQETSFGSIEIRQLLSGLSLKP